VTALTAHQHATTASELAEIATATDDERARDLAHVHALTSIALALPELSRKLDLVALKIERHIKLG
jgi:hypothetical protein